MPIAIVAISLLLAFSVAQIVVALSGPSQTGTGEGVTTLDNYSGDSAGGTSYLGLVGGEGGHLDDSESAAMLGELSYLPPEVGGAYTFRN